MEREGGIRCCGVACAVLTLLLLAPVSRVSGLSITVNNHECLYEYVFNEGDSVSGSFVVVDHDIFWSSDHPGIDFTEMARFRVTARKSVPPFHVRKMIPSSTFQPRTRAQADIRMKQIALDNQDRTIMRLRVCNAEKRREVEDLNTLLTASKKRVNEVFHQFEFARGDNFDLRDAVEIAEGQAKRAKEEVDRYRQDLVEARQARLGNKKKLEEAWTTIMQLSENNQRLTKEVNQGKVKKKAVKEKNEINCAHASDVLDEAVTNIMVHVDEIAQLKLENQNLQWQIEDLVNPEDPEEDPEEEEEVPPTEAIGDGEID